MAIAVGGSEGPTANINVTPLIDVLLVLLIIFMVINPPDPKGLDALVPQPNPNQQAQPPEQSRTIVIQIECYPPGPVCERPDAPTQLKINQEIVTPDTLGPRLDEIFKTRSERVAFVKGDPTLEFRQVARVIDIAKGVNIDKIGLITAKIEEGR